MDTDSTHTFQATQNLPGPCLSDSVLRKKAGSLDSPATSLTHEGPMQAGPKSPVTSPEAGMVAGTWAGAWVEGICGRAERIRWFTHSSSRKAGDTSCLLEFSYKVTPDVFPEANGFDPETRQRKISCWSLVQAALTWPWL